VLDRLSSAAPPRHRRLCHVRLQVVDPDRSRHSAEPRQRPVVTPQPGQQILPDGRIAERDLGAYESFDDDEFEGSERVRTLSIFRGRYRVATCIVDRSRRLQMMLVMDEFDDLPSAEIAFRNGG
jgi:hypothetical protein